MYSVIRQGGMQFIAEKGKNIKVPLLDQEPGTEIEIKDVLMVGGDNVKVGTPVVDGASVKAKVIDHGKESKIRVFKRKKRKRYRKTIGHRQQFTTIEILDVKAGK